MLAHEKQKYRFFGVSANLSDFYVNMRTALADLGTGGVYQWKNENLDGALLSVVDLGIGPQKVVVNTDRTGFDPGPDTPDARGYLVFQAALLLLGGMIPMGVRTRAFSATVYPAERTLTLDHLRRLIRRIETEGDPHGNGGKACFGVWEDLENTLSRTSQPSRTNWVSTPTVNV